ncbi:MAG TPA: hypothetical protein DDY14_09995 [Chromatiaceae bacterium]|nr:hypothetical protein [Chromatiaceae bacterium]
MGIRPKVPVHTRAEPWLHLLGCFGFRMMKPHQVFLCHSEHRIRPAITVVANPDRLAVLVFTFKLDAGDVIGHEMVAFEMPVDRMRALRLFQ